MTVSIHVRKKFGSRGREVGLNIIHDHGLLIFFFSKGGRALFISGVNENWGLGTNRTQLFIEEKIRGILVGSDANMV